MQTANSVRSKLHVLHVKPTCKAADAQASAPELEQGQIRLCEKQRLNSLDPRKVPQALVTLVGSHEQITEMASGFSSIFGRHEGPGG